METGKLYICPTPIGNLEDITLRTLRVLKEVDLIAAEDTRHSINLLNHYDIKRPLTSYHEHNIRQKGGELVDKLKEGLNIAIITDAGMPGISDPGSDIIRLAIEEDIEVIGLPGASAGITALVVSGLPTERFVFEGFLPSKKQDKKKRLKEIESECRTIILYESPHRILATLEDILEILGNRNIAVVRELTKLYEEVFRSDIQGALEKFSQDRIRGEFVLILQGGKEEEDEEIDILRELQKYIDDGFSKKESVKMLAEIHNIRKNIVYGESLKLKDK